MSEKKEKKENEYPKLVLRIDGTYTLYIAPEMELKILNREVLKGFLENKVKNIDLSIRII